MAAFLAVTALVAPASPAVGQVAADTPRLKAVFVVGPTHGSTGSYLQRAEEMAQEAEDAGMDVRRVFFPNATWERVLEHAQGANLLVYLGHGYGWPSPYTGKMTESRQNGMGLNTFAGSGPAEYKYYGATPIRQNIRLAPNAVVILMHGCYTAGNAESGMAIPSPDLARQRVDNFANGFLAAGAGAMFALAWGTRIDYPAALVNTNQTMDQLFMTPADHVGWNDMYFNSVRTPGARNHLDPDQHSGYHRAVTGRLNMTTAEWRAGAGQIVPPPPPPPGVPTIEMPAPSKAKFFASDSDSILPSTLLKVKLAVPSSLHWRIVNAGGTTVRDHSQRPDSSRNDRVHLERQERLRKLRGPRELPRRGFRTNGPGRLQRRANRFHGCIPDQPCGDGRSRVQPQGQAGQHGEAVRVAESDGVAARSLGPYLHGHKDWHQQVLDHDSGVVRRYGHTHDHGRRNRHQGWPAVEHGRPAAQLNRGLAAPADLRNQS